MQIKTIQPMRALCFETKTSLTTLPQYIRVVARRLYKDAVEQNLEITGPVYWIYEGADGQPDTIFNLTIALPVHVDDFVNSESEFELKNLEYFHCLAKQHPGDWSKLGETYGALFAELQHKNLKPSGINREIYLNMDFNNPDGNITEVEIGLAD